MCVKFVHNALLFFNSYYAFCCLSIFSIAEYFSRCTDQGNSMKFITHCLGFKLIDVEFP